MFRLATRIEVIHERASITRPCAYAGVSKKHSMSRLLSNSPSSRVESTSNSALAPQLQRGLSQRSCLGEVPAWGYLFIFRSTLVHDIRFCCAGMAGAGSKVRSAPSCKADRMLYSAVKTDFPWGCTYNGQILHTVNPLLLAVQLGM